MVGVLEATISAALEVALRLGLRYGTPPFVTLEIAAVAELLDSDTVWWRMESAFDATACS